jgi:hypothetical protein
MFGTNLLELTGHKKTASKTGAVKRLKTRKTKESMVKTTLRLPRRMVSKPVPHFIKEF